MSKYTRIFTLGVAAAALSACGADEATVPEGETNLSCAAYIYAATNLVDDAVSLQATGESFSKYVAVMTKFGTAHAKEEGLDAQSVLGVVKLEAMRITGRIGQSSTVVSDAGVIKRAKACYGE